MPDFNGSIILRTKSPSNSKKSPYPWDDEFGGDEVARLQKRALDKVKEADKDQKSAEELRQKSESLDAKALEIRQNMNSVYSSGWAYAYLTKDADEKEQQAKQFYQDHIKKAKAAEHEWGQFDEDITEAIRLRNQEFQPARGAGPWYGPHHPPPGPIKFYATCHCRCHWQPHIWKGICWCCT